MKTLYIDISGKQEYIFQSNRLKINIGASYIMDKHITQKQIIASLNTLEGEETWTNETIQRWRTEGDTVNRIVFIGGGSALLAFDHNEQARVFSQHFSAEVLRNYPGIHVNISVWDDFDFSDFQHAFRQLKDQQRREKNEHGSLNEPFLFGIEEEDVILGKPVTHRSKVLKDDTGAKEEISLEVVTKVKGAKESELEFKETLKEILVKDERNCSITNEMDEIVPDQEAGYIAVVHVDGNGFGKKFMEAPDLITFRNESVALEKNLNEVLESVFKNLVDEIDDDGKIKIDAETEIECYRDKKDGQFRVPFRPIINAGDDITFVCHGRLGFYLADLYLKELLKKGMYACAGVAIVHTKFPFYKAYKMAEDLCQQGKLKSRTIENSSWIQFFRSTGGFAGDLDEIVDRQFHGKFKTEPYLVSENPEKETGDIEVNNIEAFYGVLGELENWNTNKILQLREALKNETELATLFAVEAEKAKYRENGKNNQISPQYQKNSAILFDAIEMRGFVLKNQNV
jgi:hypothetical protein